MIPKIPSQPLEKIALSCSGGGYRAASFHLGAMSYLNRIQYNGKPLLENVKLISTVSGGTITGAVYALKKQEGKSFKEIYDFLLEKLHTLDLIKLSLHKLNPDASLNNRNKRKNLINAFAELYDEHFTSGATFEIFNKMNSHIEGVVFNSTEFNNGINFRFRNKDARFFGNNLCRIDPSTAQEVKIADAIASSSCFPGGFEPMIWPNDFVHDKSPKLVELEKRSASGIGLMDGGIYDNQGIQSILLYKKSDDTPYFDLVIISDVSSPYMDPFKPFQENQKEGLRALSLNLIKNKIRNTNRTFNIGLITATILLVSIPIFWNYTLTFYTGLLIGLTLVPLAIMLFKWILLSKVMSAVRYGRNVLVGLIPEFYRSKFSNLKIEDLSLHRLEPLLFDRLNSLITLLNDVFLKVVRRLNYGDLYNDKKYMYRRMSNLIKELTEIDFTNGKNQVKPETKDSIKYKGSSKLKGDYNEVVGPRIKAVVEEASSFGTTLWFTEDNQLHNMLDKLVATGQFTMCYNMLDYLEQIMFVENNGFEDLDQDTKKNLETLYDDCIRDWESFKRDPEFLIKDMR